MNDKETGAPRRGEASSDSLKYAQVINSPEDKPEHDGKSLVTTNPEVIRNWAERRNAKPATIPGSEHEGHLGVLRFDFGSADDKLTAVGWDEWLETFNDRRLNFIYQETRSDGTTSNFFQLENPDREDA